MTDKLHEIKAQLQQLQSEAKQRKTKDAVYDGVEVALMAAVEGVNDALLSFGLVE